MGLISGIIGVIFKLNDMKTNDIATSFQKGAADLLGAALVVGMARGVLVVLGGSDPSVPSVLNTVLHAAAGAIGQLPASVSAWFMYIFQSIFNFFVTSGSGQAALTMPMMAPLSDLVGVTRQVAVLAFQFGDGFTNLVVPTSGALIGCPGGLRPVGEVLHQADGLPVRLLHHLYRGRCPDGLQLISLSPRPALGRGDILLRLCLPL